ncbi:MAG: glycosyltransferase family 39 protein [Blastocatellia bacterium]|nr:glycosyltransferase family 39 protein [Blastocatellia bacterium]MCS7156869.1 glycosyltransferase family 39 protein [Blastocatellia bacterium]MCX7752827.1 glycosyltransferase family 39 protein [Blastocatellia bacterium]MDW8167561.1 glycosyltransferase family 39 protein [Acidobacteriota bacterium]MDW8256161.1 glycosyltransferase family 39 protein [Acidobacteriota bacterium]
MKSAWGLLAIIVPIVLVNPLYEYPVGDDWTYALSVQHFLQTGRLRLPDESAASLVFQTIWGALFCWPFGFSFSALHLSTLALSLAGLWAFYRLCVLRLEDMNAERARFPLLAALALWFNPIVFTLSFTFFTDVPFLGLFLLALYFFAKSRVASEERERTRALILGALFSSFAVLVRQYAILLPVGFFLSLLGERRADERSWPRWVAIGMPMAVLLGFYIWIAAVHGMPTQFRFAQLEMLKTYRIAHDLRHLPFIVVFYLGAFALPLVGAARWRALLGERGKLVLVVLLLLSGYAAYSLWADGRHMPYLTDSAILPAFGKGGGVVFTAISAWAGALVLAAVVEEGRASWGAFYRAHARIFRFGTGVLGLLALLFATDLGRSFFIEGIDRALVAYYQVYTATTPSQRGLDYWRGRVEDFYVGLEHIVYGLALLGLIATFAGERWRFAGVRGEGGRSWQAWMTRFLLLLAALFLGLFVAISCRFDRYLLVFFPIGLLLGARRLAPRLRPSLAVLLLIGLGGVAIATAKTMIAGYGALWRAGNELLARGVPIEEINLNYTFNAWTLYQRGKREIERTGQPSYWAYAARREFRYWGWPPDEPAEVVLEVPYWDFLRWRWERVRVWRVRDR